MVWEVREMKHTVLVLCLLFQLLLTSCQGSDSAGGSSVSSRSPESVVSQSVQETFLPDFSQPEQVPEVPSQPESEGLILARTLTLEEQVGQLFLARCPETGAVEDIQTYHLGGYVLFGRDFKNDTPESLSLKLSGYQKAACVPLLLAVDEEGGSVTRISYYPAYREQKFYSPRYLYRKGELTAVLETEAEKCQLLKLLGINVNLAPVCDITTDPDAFLYYRSLGQTPDVTGEVIASMVHTMSEHSVGSVLKHFPGYGNNVDTHVGIAVDDRTLEELENCDLIPFASGIEAGCGAILVSHTVLNCFDSEYPASLSPAVHTYLRETMGFDGVIMTDDLVMQAITDRYGAGEAAILAVLAGNDLLCSSEYQIQYRAVLDAVKEGRISKELLELAVSRVLQWKYDLGLLKKEV